MSQTARSMQRRKLVADRKTRKKAYEMRSRERAAELAERRAAEPARPAGPAGIGRMSLAIAATALASAGFAR